MTLQEFTTKYYLHDSLFEDVIYITDSKKVEMRIDFAYWMQEWYTDDKPETDIITLTFNDVKTFTCPQEILWEQISIIQTSIKSETIIFSVMNDITDEYFDIVVDCKSVDVT